MNTYVSVSPDSALDLIVWQHYWWQRLTEHRFRLGNRHQVSQEKLSYTSSHRDPYSLFYMPGTIGGAFVVDYLGPKYTMVR